jgi:hypothetical protein
MLIDLFPWATYANDGAATRYDSIKEDGRWHYLSIKKGANSRHRCGINKPPVGPQLCAGYRAQGCEHVATRATDNYCPAWLID